MTLLELMDAYRVRTNDTSAPYLWSNDEIRLYLNEAQQEAAERGLLIHDSTTPIVCEIALEIGVGIYDLHPSILVIDRARLTSGSNLLAASREQLDAASSSWETNIGTPQRFIDEGNGRLTITPIPTVTDTLTLTVKRLPIKPMTVDTDAPEIHSRHHYRMLDWALRCGYLKQDADTFNDESAKKYEAAFELSFGYRADANVQRKQRDLRRRPIKISW